MYIINKSISTSTYIVPYYWKLSSITPVPKIKNTNQCYEFRHIPIPIHEKLLECTVYDKLLTFVNQHNLLSDSQSGFRSEHSCETSLNLVISNWKDDIDRGNFVTGIFLEPLRQLIDRYFFQKTKVWLGELALRWFQNYLSNYKQF